MGNMSVQALSWGICRYSPTHEEHVATAPLMRNMSLLPHSWGTCRYSPTHEEYVATAPLMRNMSLQPHSWEWISAQFRHNLKSFTIKTCHIHHRWLCNGNIAILYIIHNKNSVTNSSRNVLLVPKVDRYHQRNSYRKCPKLFYVLNCFISNKNCKWFTMMIKYLNISHSVAKMALRNVIYTSVGFWNCFSCNNSKQYLWYRMG